MSYTSSVKTDMLRNMREDRRLANAELAGLLAAAAKITFRPETISFRIRTDSAAFARYIYRLSDMLYDIRPTISAVKTATGGHRRFTAEFADGLNILTGTGFLARGRHWHSPVFRTIVDAPEDEQRSFLRGVFLGCGSLADPERTYHLELAAGAALAEVAVELLRGFDIRAGIVGRKSQSVVYIKDSEQVSDFLRLIGAYSALLSFENVRINKEIRNEVNRQVNCETANINKTTDAAGRELHAIGVLRRSGAFDDLPDNVREAAMLREQYPDDSIGELIEHSGGISRSTMHRRLKKLVDTAAALGEVKNDTEKD